MYASTTKVVQIVTLDWPWPILRQGQIWLHRLLYGRKWKSFFFGTYCSLRSQSCLKHSAEWVNEVEWVSKVKVILWPWSKVTQISKLNVWLLVCILRWAIQGLLALLFLFKILRNQIWPSSLTLLHSESPKLYTILAFLSAIRLSLYIWWLWVDLDLFYGSQNWSLRLFHGKSWKSAFFCCYCALLEMNVNSIPSNSRSQGNLVTFAMTFATVTCQSPVNIFIGLLWNYLTNVN